MRLALVGVILATVLAAGGSASGAIMVGDKFLMTQIGESQHQGPFQMTEQASANYSGPPAAGGDNFRTFCVEVAEHFNFGGTYKVDNISVETSTTNFFLSGYSAWVFANF